MKRSGKTKPMLTKIKARWNEEPSEIIIPSEYTINKDGQKATEKLDYSKIKGIRSGRFLHQSFDPKKPIAFPWLWEQ